MDSNVVIEGFICPVCKKSFRTPDLLTMHFSTHAEALELKTDPRLHQSLTKEFLEIREANKKLSLADTNDLLIKLDKLVNGKPLPGQTVREYVAIDRGFWNDQEDTRWNSVDCGLKDVISTSKTNSSKPERYRFPVQQGRVCFKTQHDGNSVAPTAIGNLILIQAVRPFHNSTSFPSRSTSYCCSCVYEISTSNADNVIASRRSDVASSRRKLIIPLTIYTFALSVFSSPADFEQSVVPWIETKIDRCPSCNRSFGLRRQPDTGDDSIDDASSSNSGGHDNSGRLGKLLSSSKLLKRANKLTNAVLDFNPPVYRRLHHCRLCGFIACADCCHFLVAESAKLFIDQSVASYLSDDDCKRLPASPSSCDPGSASLHRLVFVTDTSSVGGNKDYLIRVCLVCRNLLEHKFLQLRRRLVVVSNTLTASIVQMHKELRLQMTNVNEAMPIFNSIAESICQGENRYTLDYARAMRFDIVEKLHKIHQFGQKFVSLANTNSSSLTAVDEPASRPAGTSTGRLSRLIAARAREFANANLPPLQDLPTSRQHDERSAQLQSSLASKWIEEDRALEELERQYAASATTTKQAKSFLGKASPLNASSTASSQGGSDDDSTKRSGSRRQEEEST